MLNAKLKKLAVILLIMAVFVFGSILFTGASKTTTLRFVTANHPWTDAIKPLIPDFEKATGIKINIESYEENQLNPKLSTEFISGTSTIDVFMTRPLQEGKLFAKNKWYQELNKYINKKGMEKWNWKDYPEAAVKAITYDNKICSVPLVTEWQVVFYRKDLFEKFNLKPPATLEDLEKAAKTLHNPANEMYGIVSRGQRAAAVTQFSSYLYGFGGDFIKKGKCVLDTAEAINAFKFYGRLLKEYGPPGVTNMSWPQAQALFASGKVAMWTDASVLISGLLNPEKSTVSDKIGVAVFPTGPAGSHPFMVIPWAIAISNQSKNKDTAWKFLEWATSVEMTKKAQIAGNTMTRTSAWEDARVVAKIHPDIIMTFKKTGKIATPYDRPLMTAVVEARDAIGDVIVKSIETGGTLNLSALTKTAAEKINELLKNANEYEK